MRPQELSRISSKVFARCFKDFDDRIKHDFRNDGQQWAVDVGIEAEFPEADIEGGYMTFTNEEILRCFEPVVNRILELTRIQITAVQAQGKNIQVRGPSPFSSRMFNSVFQSVLVTGPASASEYLFAQISLQVARYARAPVQPKVVRLVDSGTAVARGAVTAGINEIIPFRISGAYYSIGALRTFRVFDNPNYRMTCLDGKDRCRHTHHIIVQNYRRLRFGEPKAIFLKEVLASRDRPVFGYTLYRCSEALCPYHTNSQGEPNYLQYFQQF